MRCEKCGATLPENTVRCIYCGEVFQMVPDYNPLGDVIEDEVRSAIRLEPSEIPEHRSQYTRNIRQNHNTRNLRENNTGRVAERNTGRVNAKKDNMSKEIQEIENRKRRDAERRREAEKRKAIERRRAKKRKQRNIIIGIIIGIIGITITCIVVAYNQSYAGQLNKGIKATENNETLAAIEYFENAIEKDSKKATAYIALSELYADNNDMSEAESVLLEAIALNLDDLELSEALIDLYIMNDEMSKINEYMENLTNAELILALEQYQSNAPVFSLAEGTYENVQELTITSEEDFIYYTLDGTEATEDSLRYTSAIQIGEGTTVVRAISVNAEGVPSYESTIEYVVEFPMESAPVVSPTTGQYTESMQITVTVPAGYTAYYTLDNTTPTVDSKLYTGPIDMPEGNTIFTVVLVNSSGRYSDATKRNYELVIEEDIEETIEE